MVLLNILSYWIKSKKALGSSEVPQMHYLDYHKIYTMVLMQESILQHCLWMWRKRMKRWTNAQALGYGNHGTNVVMDKRFPY